MPISSFRALPRPAGLLGALLLALALLLPGSAAGAHTALVSSDPADDARVAELPERLTLTFSEGLQQLGTGAQLAGPQGAVAVDVNLAGAQLIATVPANAPAPAGEYTLTYRVTSADGHPVSGEVRFTTEAERAGAAEPTAAPVPTGEPTETTPAPSPTLNEPVRDADTTSEDGTPAVWIGLVVLALLAAAGGGFAWWRKRSR